MEFAENGRISHRQLYRQMILTLLAPFLLGMFGERRMWGIGGVIGTIAAVILVVFYVIFLIRLAPYYGNIRRSSGVGLGTVMGLFFLGYVVLAGAYLLALLDKIVPEALATGVDGKWISLVALAACLVGIGKGMQKRGRMAEVSGGFLLGGIVLMMAVCISQGKWGYLGEIFKENGDIRWDFLNAGYETLCAFSALGLLPFLLEDVEKQGSAGKTVIFGVVTLGGILVGMELILPAVFGMGRLGTERYPVLPLMAGADLPGDVLARFDVIWMGFLLYSMLFAVGSLLHYGQVIVKKMGADFRICKIEKSGGRICDESRRMGEDKMSRKKDGHLKKEVGNKTEEGMDGYKDEKKSDKIVCSEKQNMNMYKADKGNKTETLWEWIRRIFGSLWVPILIYFVSIFEYRGRGIEDYFAGYLAYIFVPGMVLLQVILFWMGRGRWKKKMAVAASSVLMMVLLGGCSAAVEPEKRMYPLALGVDIYEGAYVFSYGMPEMNKATGQEKSGEEKTGALEISGYRFEKIESNYEQSQSKFMDLGHLEALVLGESLLLDDRWEEVLEYLKEKPFVGEDVYVFLAENAGEVLSWKGEESASVGEYLTGMMENRMRTKAKREKEVTLREIFHNKYQSGSMGKLPRVRIVGENLVVEV